MEHNRSIRRADSPAGREFRGPVELRAALAVAPGCVRPMSRREDAHLCPRSWSRKGRPSGRRPDRRDGSPATATDTRPWSMAIVESQPFRSPRCRPERSHERLSDHIEADGPEGPGRVAGLATPRGDGSPILRARNDRSEKSPVRLAFVYVPNGVHMPDWTPRSARRRTCALADPRTTARGQGRDPRPQRVDPEPGAGARRRRRRPRPGHGQLPDGPPPRKTGGADLSAGVSVDQLAARSVGQADAFPFAGDRLRRAARTPASATTVIAVPISRTSRGRASRRPSPSRSIPGWSSIGCSATRRGCGRLAPDVDRRRKSILDFVARGRAPAQ